MILCRSDFHPHIYSVIVREKSTQSRAGWRLMQPKRVADSSKQPTSLHTRGIITVDVDNLKSPDLASAFSSLSGSLETFR
jgi:hypothetical protein